MTLPLIAFTMRDPAGIGSEIVVKVAGSPEFSSEQRAFVIGDIERLEHEVRTNKLLLQIEELSAPEQLSLRPGVLAVLAGPPLPADLPCGRVDARAGRAAFSFVLQAIEIANTDRIDAICTAPIHKEALAAAGMKYPGHNGVG